MVMNPFEKVAGKISQGKTIVEGKLKLIEEKRKELLAAFNGIDFAIPQAAIKENPLENLINLITSQYNKLSEVCQNHCKNDEKSGSDSYLNAISKAATNLVDALNLAQKNPLTPTLLKMVHERFKKLTKALLSAATAKFILSTGAKLDYTPTKKTLKDIGLRVGIAEKTFANVVGQVCISILLDNFNGMIKDNAEKFFTKSPKLNLTLYFPTATAGKYEPLKINWNFNRFDTSGGKVEFLVKSLNDIYAIATKKKLSMPASEIKKLIQSLMSIVKDLPKETFQCPICMEDFELSSDDITVIPCKGQHAFCNECAKGTFSIASNTTCPVCREPIKDADIKKILARAK